MKYSLKKHEDFRIILNNGKKIELKTFNVFVLKSEIFLKHIFNISKHRHLKYLNLLKEGSLLGILTSKKFGKSNKRNSAKRKIRKIFFDICKARGYTFVAIPKARSVARHKAIKATSNS